MRFMDPLSIKCSHCGYSDFYTVNALLNLKAKCNKCKTSLDGHGLEMRKLMVENSIFFGKVYIALLIEEEFNFTISDDDMEKFIEKFVIVNDFSDFVASRVTNISKDEIIRNVLRITKDVSKISDGISPDTAIAELFEYKDFKNCYKYNT